MGNEQTSIDEQKEIMEKFPDSKEQIFNFYTEENNESNKEFNTFNNLNVINLINLQKVK